MPAVEPTEIGCAARFGGTESDGHGLGLLQDEHPNTRRSLSVQISRPIRASSEKRPPPRMTKLSARMPHSRGIRIPTPSPKTSSCRSATTRWCTTRARSSARCRATAGRSSQTLALPPLNMHLAREAMARTRIHELLQGVRGRPQAALDEIALTLVKVSQLVIDFGEIVELDINPLLADEFGVMALDARVRVQPTSEHPAKRLAIRPYPKELEETRFRPPLASRRASHRGVSAERHVRPSR